MATALPIRSYGSVTPIQQVQKEERLPKYHCSTCERCKDNHCEFFNRYVETNYNRCFNHTNYVKTPNLHYVSPTEGFFKAIQASEAKRIKELQKI